MPYNSLSGKGCTWWNVTDVNDQDLETLQKRFKFHALDYEDIREGVELPKIDTYKYYAFGVFTIPRYDTDRQHMTQDNLAFFVNKDTLVTVSKTKIPALEALFSKAHRHSGLRRELTEQTPGFTLYRVLDEAFDSCRDVVTILNKEITLLEERISEQNSRQATIELAKLRRNVLFLIRLLKPQRRALRNIVSFNAHVIAPELGVYFEDVEDTLDGIGIVADNIKTYSDGLFEVNETFLAHRTNDTIRTLTIISVALMPPTLLASFYGMNVQGLPFADHAPTVILLLLVTLVIGLMSMIAIDRQRFKK